MVAILAVAIYFSRRSNENSNQFFIGGRSLGPWVAALSAEANDMAVLLLLVLPGMAYFSGLAMVFWYSVGLIAGVWTGWFIIAKRLRRYSFISQNSITLPEFFTNRFKEKKPVLLLISSLLILIFFCIFAAFFISSAAKLFSIGTGLHYQRVVVIMAISIMLYTLSGGFLAVCTTDFFQAVFMIVSLVTVLVVSIAAAEGIRTVFEGAAAIPGFIDILSSATPETEATGQQSISITGEALFGEAAPLDAVAIISAVSLGLGVFGMPQTLTRYMAIKKIKYWRNGRYIAVFWCLLCLIAAIFIGIAGRYLYPSEFLTSAGSETIFLHISNVLLDPLLAGVVIAGMLVAVACSADSFLLISSSSFSINIFKGLIKKEATDKHVMIVSRVSLVLLTPGAMLIALYSKSVFGILGLAWAGFAACFGSVIIFSLFWERTSYRGAVAGMAGGAFMLLLWKFALRPLGGFFDIYELLPAFIFACILILVFSLTDKKPSAEINEEFRLARNPKSSTS